MRNRRDFLVEVGQGMLVGRVGTGLAADMGLAGRALADEAAPKTPAGMERLVALLQETPVPKLMPTLVEQLEKGVTLRQLVAAGALANAHAFGGHNYDGYHTFMALAPSFAMAQELPEKQRALPVFKVLHRNCADHGQRSRQASRPACRSQAGRNRGRQADRTATGRADAKQTHRGGRSTAPGRHQPLAGRRLQRHAVIVQDEVNVHRVVLAWRSWETLDFTGKEHARTLLRQSVHFCCDENGNKGNPIRTLLPQLMEKYKLMDKKPGTKEADDAWVEKLSQTIYAREPDSGGRGRGGALGDGNAPEVVGEAMSIACARLVLGDPGRDRSDNPAKPIGSVHGDSVGVHASDSANAWRHIARVSNPRNTFASLIAGAYHTAGQNGRQMKGLHPNPEVVETIREKDPAVLLKLTEEAIRARTSAALCALAHCYGKAGHDARGLFNVLLRFAVSEDGALHAEKYYRTVSEEFAAVRPAFRWRHLVALSRVTASEYGQTAPGVEEARKLLG